MSVVINRQHLTQNNVMVTRIINLKCREPSLLPLHCQLGCGGRVGNVERSGLGEEGCVGEDQEALVGNRVERRGGAEREVPGPDVAVHL